MLPTYAPFAPQKPLAEPKVLILTGSGAPAAAAALPWLFPTLTALHIRKDRLQPLLCDLSCVSCEGEPLLVIFPEDLGEDEDLSQLAKRFGVELVEISSEQHPAITVSNAVWAARHALGIW